MLLIRLSILAVLGLGACTIPNETHCGNQRGDETCAERHGEAMYCDVCVSDNDGCVSSVPDAACRWEEHATETGSASATTSALPTDPTTAPSTSVGSASASGSTTSDDPTTPLSASESDATTAEPTSDDDGSTSDTTGTTDPDSTTSGDPTEGSDATSTTDPTDPSTTVDPSMTTDPTEDPTDATTGETCLGLGDECEAPEDCCGGVCVPDLVLGIDVCL